MQTMLLRGRLLVAVVTVALLGAACSGGRGGSGSGGGTATQAGSSGGSALNATTAPLLPTEVDALPAFDPATYRELLAQLRGTPVVVNVWASWCGPCRAEAPHLREAALRFGDRVQFLGVDILDARPSARAFIAEFGWPYPSVFDATGAIRDGLGLIGQPVTLIYDAGGELVFTWLGPIDRDTLVSEVEKVL